LKGKGPGEVRQVNVRPVPEEKEDVANRDSRHHVNPGLGCKEGREGRTRVTGAEPKKPHSEICWLDGKNAICTKRINKKRHQGIRGLRKKRMQVRWDLRTNSKWRGKDHRTRFEIFNYLHMNH